MSKKIFMRALSRCISAIQALPIVVPAVLATFSVVVVGLLLLGRLDNELVVLVGFPFSLIVFMSTWKLSAKADRVGSQREQKWFDVLVLVGVVAWVFIGVRYTSQNVFVYRDPGIYTVAAEKIRKSPNLDMEATQVFGGSKVISTASAAFGISTQDKRQISTQGLHLFPSLLGLIGRATSQSVMLHAGPIFGGTALLAVYGFARLLLRPRWAAFAVGTLSATLPFIYFSRDTYSELLAATFTFGALSLLWLAQKAGSLRLWALAGLLLGAGTLTRVDAYLTIAAIIFALACYFVAGPSSEKKIRARQIAVLSAATLVVVLVGWLDLTRLSSAYYNNLRTEFLQQAFLIILATAAGAVLIVANRYIALLGHLWKKHRATLGSVVVCASVVIIVALASRPLWLVSHGRADVQLIAAVQESSGVEVEANRNYAENSLTWLMWYVGLPLLLAGFVGGGMLVRRSTKGGEITTLLPVLLVVGGTSLVYLIRPSITADQVWASRRFLPVIIPGVIVFGVYAIQKLSETSYVQGRYVQQGWGLFMALLIAAPFYHTYPFLRERMHVPQLQQVRELCDTLPVNSAIIWVGTMSQVAPRTSDVFCGFPSVGYKNASLIDAKSLAELAKSARSSGFVPVIGSDDRGLSQLPESASMRALTPIKYNVVPSTLFAPPKGVANETRTIHVGVIDPRGRIIPGLHE